MNDQQTYVLDTNVLLHDPNAIFSFPNSQVVIPLAVIEEIDDQKKRQDEVGRNARLVSRHLDELRSQGPLSQGVPLIRERISIHEGTIYCIAY